MNILMSFDWPPVLDALIVKAAACISASYAGIVIVMWFEHRLENRMRERLEDGLAPLISALEPVENHPSGP